MLGGSDMSHHTSCPSLRVLIVDKCPDNRGSLHMLLTLWGCKVCEAADGPAALDQAAAFHPDVILLDVCLPRLDGYAVARQVRQLPGLANVLLMALTGYGREEDSTRSREA